MATWTNIADTVLEPGKPIRAIDARALRDNPIAIAEGASGAPKIETAGIDDGAITLPKLQPLEAGTNFILARVDTERATTNSAAFVEANIFTIVGFSGVVTVTFQHRIDGGGFQSIVQVRRNNVVLTTFSTFSTAFVDQVFDVSVDPNDNISLFHTTTNLNFASRIRLNRVNSNAPWFGSAVRVGE